MASVESAARSRRWRLRFGSAAVVALLASLVSLGGTTSSRVLATVHAHYLEDAAIPRPIAAITAQLVADGTAAYLELSVLAVGVGVEPLPGIAGVPGSNLRTAEELERLLRESSMRLVSRSSGVVSAGRLTAVTRGFVPRRRWGVDGGIESAPADGRELPIAVRFRSAPLPVGTSQTYLECDSVPRLMIEVVRADGLTPSLHVASLPEHQPRTRLR